MFAVHTALHWCAAKHFLLSCCVSLVFADNCSISYDGHGMSAGGSKANAAHEQDANAQNGHAQMSASATVISGGASAASAMPLDFRVLTEAIAMRPNKGAYGVPFDLVDTSQGSALSEMLEQLQEADTALTAMNIMNHSVEARR